MRRLTVIEQTIVGAVIGLLIVVAFYFLGWRPQADTISQYETDYQAELAKNKEAKLTLARLKAAKAEAAKVEAQLVRLSNRIPDDPELASLLVELQDAANEAGVSMTAFKPTEPIAEAGVSKIALAVEIKGTFFDTVDFLYRLENLPRAIKVQTVSIAATEYPELRSTLGMDTYMRGAPPGEEGGVQPLGGAPGAAPAPAAGGQ